MPHHHHHHSHHHHSHHHHSHHSDNAAHGSSRLSGHKRERERDSGFSDSSDGSYVKLFVGSVPRTISEDQVRPMFEEYGEVLEVAILRDKRTGLQQGCCFVKYSSRDEADRAIRYLNNQRALPGGNSPVQVRYADGERERLGAIEHKLFVGCLNKNASEKQVEEIFSRFGRVDDVYIMRDEHKQSRGCAFIKFPSKDIAHRAIASLNNVYVMEGCDQPLAVRFADPKRPKTGDSRASFSPRHSSGSNRSSGVSGRSGSPISWRQTNAASLRGLSQGGGSPYPPPALTRVSPSHAASPANVHGQLNGIPQYTVQPQLMHTMSSVIAAQQASTQRPGQSFAQVPLQQYVQLSQQHSLPYQLQQPVPTIHLQSAQQQFNPPPTHQSFPQLQLSAQQLPSLQQSLTPAHQSNQQQQQLQPLHLQNSPQQQLSHILQPTTIPHQQASWLLPTAPPVAATPTQLLQSLAGPPLLPPTAPTTTCNWTEHVSPEGHKYYYNSVTLESKWEKPDELLKLEQQQQQQHQAPLPPPPPVLPIQDMNLQQFRAGSLEQLRQQIWL